MDENQKLKKPQRSVLGRGLSALISTPPMGAVRGGAAERIETIPSVMRVEPVEQAGRRIAMLKVSEVSPNPDQPRREFAEAELQQLSESVREHGILQPILVRRREISGGKLYEIVAGERRYRAAQRAGLVEVPALVEDFDNRTALEVAIIENVQRADLTPVEEAAGYQRLSDDFGMSHSDIAKRTGKDRVTISNIVRILKLSPGVLRLVEERILSLGHAKVLLAVKEPSAQLNLAKKVLGEQLSVRALEQIVSRVVVLEPLKAAPTKQSSDAAVGSGDEDAGETFPELEKRLREGLGTKVTIKHQRSGRGKIAIEYFSTEELDRLVELMSSFGQ